MHLTDVKISVAAKSFQTFVTRLTSCDREFFADDKTHVGIICNSTTTKNIGHFKPVSALTITTSGLFREGTQEISRIWELGK